VTDFAQAAGDAVESIGPGRLRVLASGIEAGSSEAALCAGAAVPGYADAVRAIRSAQTGSGLPDAAAAIYLRGVADGYARSAAWESVESVWSGPSSHAVPVRSTAQVLVELIGDAIEQLVLMTYSARPYPPVVDALIAARGRGVRVWVVVETLQGAGGALGGTEPAAAFLGVPGVELWHWPAEVRGDSSAKMHAKIAVADQRVLLVSSANLTQSGVGANLEAGVLVRGGYAPRRAAEHVAHLIAAGELVRLHESHG